MFRAKLLAALTDAGLALPEHYPEKWGVDCKHVGSGEKALIYLGRYLYRGVIQEKDILACENGQVTFRYQNGKTRKREHRTVSGVEFLRLLLRKRPAAPPVQFSLMPAQTAMATTHQCGC